MIAEIHNAHGVPGLAESYWIRSTPQTNYPSLVDGLSVDVAVLGGGIAGISAAKMLKDRGLKVAVIEYRRICDGVTGKTTAHVSSSQGFYYKKMIDTFGSDRARLCADSCQAAVEEIAETVARHNIECDFARVPEYFYAEHEKDTDRLKDEYEASRSIELPVSFEKKTPVPIESYGAIRFNNQVQFHPKKYVLSLAETIPGDGSHIFEQTRALDVKEEKEDEPCIVKTDKGSLVAGDVIVATHFPIINKGLLFARMKSYRSYVLGIRAADEIPGAMFYNTDEPCHYFRTQETSDDEDPLIIIGGEDHQTGHAKSTRDHYRRLEKFVRDRFRLKSIEFSWSTQDNYPFDNLPFIGRNPGSSHIYVATGFKGSGMTYGTVAALLLSDIITGRENPWQELYDPSRINLIAEGGELISNTAQIAAEFVGDRIAKPKNVLDMANGEGAVAEVDGDKLAVFKDEAGKLHMLKPACAHMGCIVSWNDAEISWDCPCHGSRYDHEGRVLHSPTVKDLKKAT